MNILKYQNVRIFELVPLIKMVLFVFVTKCRVTYFTKNFDRCAHLLFANLLVLLFLGSGLEALPRQRAAIKVHAHIAERFHVIASRLLNTQMGIDGGIASRARQILIFSVHDVLAGAVVAVLLCQAEVDEKHFVAVAANAHQEVVGLDVTMNEVLVVHELNATDHLIGEHENRLHGEATRAEVEQVLQTGAEQIHHQNVVVLLLAVPADVWNADATLQDFVKFALVQELWMTRLHRF